MSYEYFDCDIRDGVAWISLLGPDSPPMNEFLEELLDMLLRLQEDRNVRVIVISDSGAPLVFAHHPFTLAEIRTSEDGPETISTEMNTISRIVTLIHESAKPVVCTVKGEVRGHGLGLMMTADVKIASPSATFTVNDPLTGLLPGWGLSHSLTRCAGQSSALEMIWSGRTLNAAEAHAKGLVDRIIDDESSEEEIEIFCRQLTNIPQPAAHLAKLAMQQTGQLDQTSMLDLEIEAQQQCWASDETAQGLSALNTNTEPDFI